MADLQKGDNAIIKAVVIAARDTEHHQHYFDLHRRLLGLISQKAMGHELRFLEFSPFDPCWPSKFV
jgi:hypothetical protein